ncbi:outer membrane beta-barrel protein [Helicobacter cetorum]|uniref:Outer membrane protein n=1 Tax=Helicobacter cetorum (strain ATCC BAA-429 / MIT 00-7128) TaxID=182217 RepID=I0EN06_HELC0|nr:outer membrane beta-barrel protein [Helicobacter cetorum]AFI04325.1 outer membrane protein [Helicobacter cetorum MIT 00-7128]
MKFCNIFLKQQQALGGGRIMRPLLLIPLVFLTDLRAEESSWYVGGSFLIGQGEQKRTITTLEPPSSPIIPPQIAPQPQPQPAPQPQEPSQKPSPKPPQKPEPEKPSQPQPQPPNPEPSQPNPDAQKEQQIKEQYTKAVEKYRDDKNNALENAQKQPNWEKYQKYCEGQVKKGQKLYDCYSVQGPNYQQDEQVYNRLFNSEQDPSSALPSCPLVQSSTPISPNYSNDALANYNCYFNWPKNNPGPIIPTALPDGVPTGLATLFSYFHRFLANVPNKANTSQNSQNPTAITTTTKQTSVHYGGSVALGYKYFFKPRFGLRGYINLEYLYTNTYFSSSNILYGGGADFLANIIDNNDKKSMVFGVFAGVNVAGNTSITQIKNHNVSNTKFDAFLHTGLRFVFNGMHEFNLGVRVPFIKNPSVSLKTKDKTYEVQNDMFYSLFVSYYYLF